MKKYLIIIVLFISSVAFSQSINDYKYIVVPMKFQFQKSPNQYRLSTNSKFLLTNNGFTVYYDDAVLPLDLAKHKCKALYFDLQESSGYFMTKLTMTLKDCQNNIIYTSKVGKSKEKEFEKSYNEALAFALEDLKLLKYKYEENDNSPVVEKVLEEKKAISYAEYTYITKKIQDGFLITDSANPNFYLKLLRTSNPSIFIGQSNENNGIVTVKADNIIFEYYKQNLLISQSLMVKIQ
jgi:hypothetical protein